MTNNEEQTWFDDYTDESQEFQVDEYDLTQSPNDFNVITIFSFVESGSVKIPGFQRHYVWDLARASKLIESLILGLPVPQLFLYEEGRNSFLVIDGQQRLMSIYYFIKERFPRKEKRAELRNIFDREGKIPDSILKDDKISNRSDLSCRRRFPIMPTNSIKRRIQGWGTTSRDLIFVQFETLSLNRMFQETTIPRYTKSSIA